MKVFSFFKMAGVMCLLTLSGFGCAGRAYNQTETMRQSYVLPEDKNDIIYEEVSFQNAQHKERFNREMETWKAEMAAYRAGKISQRPAPPVLQQVTGVRTLDKLRAYKQVTKLAADGMGHVRSIHRDMVNDRWESPRQGAQVVGSVIGGPIRDMAASFAIVAGGKAAWETSQRSRDTNRAWIEVARQQSNTSHRETYEGGPQSLATTTISNNSGSLSGNRTDVATSADSTTGAIDVKSAGGAGGQGGVGGTATTGAINVQADGGAGGAGGNATSDAATGAIDVKADGGAGGAGGQGGNANSNCTSCPSCPGCSPDAMDDLND